jgi:flagellar assembly factor FliW
MPSTLESRRFGTVRVTEEAVVRFPEGLPGFEELREFLLLSPPELEPVQFLVSCGDPEISFPILPASLCLEGYAPELESSTLQALEVPEASAPAMYAILTFHHECDRVTANLRAPVLINSSARLGRQVTLMDSTHSLRHVLVGG